MNSDLNFAVSTEGLDEKGRTILEQAKIIREALDDIQKAKARLDSWQSENKTLYDEKINRALPKMNEMSEVVMSYGDVACLTAGRLRSVEEKIKNTIIQ